MSNWHSRPAAIYEHQIWSDVLHWNVLGMCIKTCYWACKELYKLFLTHFPISSLPYCWYLQYKFEIQIKITFVTTVMMFRNQRKQCDVVMLVQHNWYIWGVLYCLARTFVMTFQPSKNLNFTFGTEFMFDFRRCIYDIQDIQLLILVINERLLC